VNLWPEATEAGQLAAGCDCCAGEAARDESWRRAARAARRLSWVSLAWMCTEGAVGLWQGLAAGSAALTGWALGSIVEGLAGVIVIWRFTGSRTLSQTAERRAQRGVAVRSGCWPPTSLLSRCVTWPPATVPGSP
jgi:hypothetical protein